jgi:hypothetical protein
MIFNLLWSPETPKPEADVSRGLDLGQIRRSRGEDTATDNRAYPGEFGYLNPLLLFS